MKCQQVLEGFTECKKECCCLDCDKATDCKEICSYVESGKYTEVEQCTYAVNE